MMQSNIIVSMMVLILTLAGCSSNPNTPQIDETDSLNKDNPGLSQLAQRRIYFGHQSVGMNIIHGLSEISNGSELFDLDIVDFGPEVSIDKMKALASNNKDSRKGFFAHGGVGKNGDPVSKLRDFEEQIDEGFGGNLDIALFKFCYKDINDQTDFAGLFQEYDHMVSRLKRKYPGLELIHITAPLRNPRLNWKNRLKLFFRLKSFQEYENNLARASYNKILNKTYTGKEPVFDIALMESTRPDGSQQGFIKNKRIYQTIYPGYTYDGGHLTPLGRKMIANGLLSELARL